MLYLLKISCRLVILLIFSLNPAYGEKVQLKNLEHIMVNAELYEGEADKPAILILHGFILTHNFPTVRRLAESLNESGYTVLTPTLSLNINNRKQSLPCEAIHTHSLEQDLIELDLWAKWLAKKTKNKIVLIGHSKGSLHIVSYLKTKPDVAVTQAIFLTIPDFGESPYSNETEEYAKIANKMIQNNNNSLYEFGLSYCKKYPTTARNYLSYYNLSKETIIKDFAEIAINKSLIMGSADKRIDLKWNQGLKMVDTNIIVIEGANHFFDFEYEFELLSQVENLLTSFE
jgi:esterase/lipase